MVLEWAALEGRGYSPRRQRDDATSKQAQVRKKTDAGLRVVGRWVHVGSAIDDVPLLAELSFEGESGRDR